MTTPSKSSNTKAQKAFKKTVKKGIRKIPAPVKAAIVVFLILGIAAGVAACLFVSRNDRFDLKGQASYTIELGSEFLYSDEGVEAFCFGLDYSDKAEIFTNLLKNAEGKYVIPTETEGTYTIIYTVGALKFNGMLSGGEPIKRVRTFTVVSTEEDGRND